MAGTPRIADAKSDELMPTEWAKPARSDEPRVLEKPVSPGTAPSADARSAFEMPADEAEPARSEAVDARAPRRWLARPAYQRSRR